MRHAVLICLFTLLPLLTQPATAADTQVTASDAIARAMPKVAPTSAVFLTLHNAGDKDLILTGASSSAARNVELHNHTMQDGMMAMRRVERIDIPAGQSVVFQPGGLHIMLIGLEKDLKAGEQIDLTLEFADAAPLQLSVPIGTPKPAGMGMGHQHQHMQMQ